MISLLVCVRSLDVTCERGCGPSPRRSSVCCAALLVHSQLIEELARITIVGGGTASRCCLLPCPALLYRESHSPSTIRHDTRMYVALGHKYRPPGACQSRLLDASTSTRSRPTGRQQLDGSPVAARRTTSCLLVRLLVAGLWLRVAAVAGIAIPAKPSRDGLPYKYG